MFYSLYYFSCLQSSCLLCFGFQLKFYILFVVVLQLMFFSLFVIQAVYSLLLCVGFTADVFQSICYLGCYSLMLCEGCTDILQSIS